MSKIILKVFIKIALSVLQCLSKCDIFALLGLKYLAISQKLFIGNLRAFISQLRSQTALLQFLISFKFVIHHPILGFLKHLDHQKIVTDSSQGIFTLKVSLENICALFDQIVDNVVMTTIARKMQT